MESHTEHLPNEIFKVSYSKRAMACSAAVTFLVSSPRPPTSMMIRIFFLSFFPATKASIFFIKGMLMRQLPSALGGDLFDDMIKCSTIFQRKTLLAKVLW